MYDLASSFSFLPILAASKPQLSKWDTSLLPRNPALEAAEAVSELEATQEITSQSTAAAMITVVGEEEIEVDSPAPYSSSSSSSSIV